MPSLKSAIRKAFYRSGLVRLVVGALSLRIRHSPSISAFSFQVSGFLVRISHLTSYSEENAIGPLQRDEAVALFGIVRAIRPKTVVEFGFLHGHSAFNFLMALDADAKLFSYDISDVAVRRAGEEFAFDPRFTFFHKSQTKFDWNDVDNRPIDFVFFDAAHELDLNQSTFEKIRPALAPDAIIAIHDTGTWARNHFGESNKRFAEKSPAGWINNDEYAHQPDERKFVDWISATYPDLASIHLHSKNTVRHGISLLQRQVKLQAT